MVELLQSVGNTLSNWLNWFSSSAISLLQNETIQLMFGILIAIKLLWFTIHLIRLKYDGKYYREYYSKHQMRD